MLKLAAVGIGLLATLFAPGYLVVRRLPLGEFNAILLFSTLGTFVLASSADLITLFLGLELMVMPAYILAGFHKTDRFSNEGGEVLPARIVRERHPPVRGGLDVWPDRLDGVHRDRASSPRA